MSDGYEVEYHKCGLCYILSAPPNLSKRYSPFCKEHHLYYRFENIKLEYRPNINHDNRIRK